MSKSLFLKGNCHCPVVICSEFKCACAANWCTRLQLFLCLDNNFFLEMLTKVNHPVVFYWLENLCFFYDILTNMLFFAIFRWLLAQIIIINVHLAKYRLLKRGIIANIFTIYMPRSIYQVTNVTSAEHY